MISSVVIPADTGLESFCGTNDAFPYKQGGLSPTREPLFSWLPLAPKKSEKIYLPKRSFIYEAAEKAPPVQLFSRVSQEELVSKRLQELDEYRTFKAGWDGVCTEPPNPACLNAAQAFLQLLPLDFVLPRVSVSGGDDVMLYWRNSIQYLAIKFNRDMTLLYYIRDKKIKNSKIIKFSQTVLPKELRDEIKYIIE